MNEQETNKKIAEVIRQQRILRGCTQQDLGNALGVTFQQVQKYERGINQVSAARLKQISDFFGVPMQLFFGADVPTNAELVVHNDHYVAAFVNLLAVRVYEQNREKGFWDEPRNFGGLLMLVTSELSEALEAHRKDLMDDHLPNREGTEVEIADAVIRLLDLCGALQKDLGGAMVEKLAYNKGRAHKHGKKY